MTHLPFIAASYALTILVIGWFGVGAWLRTRAAERRLDAIDPRRAAGGPARAAAGGPARDAS